MIVRHTRTELADYSWYHDDKDETDVTVIQRKLFASFHDETLTSFFRRLTFSPDGHFLFASAGIVEDAESHLVQHSLFIYARDDLTR
jgi:hypothetical protein